MQSLCRMAGMDLVLTQSVTMRFPLYLTFILALFTLITTLSMEEVLPEPRETALGVPAVAEKNPSTGRARAGMFSRWDMDLRG